MGLQHSPHMHITRADICAEQYVRKIVIGLTNQTNTDGSPRRILGYTRQPSSIRGELTSARPTSDSTITAN